MDFKKTQLNKWVDFIECRKLPLHPVIITEDNTVPQFTAVHTTTVPEWAGASLCTQYVCVLCFVESSYADPWWPLSLLSVTTHKHTHTHTQACRLLRCRVSLPLGQQWVSAASSSLCWENSAEKEKRPLSSISLQQPPSAPLRPAAPHSNTNTEPYCDSLTDTMEVVGAVTYAGWMHEYQSTLC